VEISARNQLKGVVTEVKRGAVSAEVVVDIGGQSIASTITVGSLDRLGLRAGDKVTAIIKASDVIIGK
jgi:molybdate transport system regulatory protein